jgi:hypothetical protein
MSMPLLLIFFHESQNRSSFIDADFDFRVFVELSGYGGTQVLEAMGELDKLVVW